jgi:16S rRNA (uracil1498-N3)-methyltransferase
MHRFFISPDQLNSEIITLEGEIAHQISRVLRLEVGSHILLLDGKGGQVEATLTEVPKSGNVLATLAERQQAKGEPSIRITLYQALLKGEKFDWVLQKGTEVGISAFVPVVTARCISERERPERWQKIVKEAAEQSRRGVLPEVVGTISLGEALTRMQKAPLALLAWEEETSLDLKAALNKLSKPPTEIALLIGPEGGITPAEVAQARNAGIETISLGRRILRAETAGPIAVAQILFHFNDV